ncbi:DNA-binding protein [Thiocystis violacea]|uniref:DNA-binding protein n=1 Tax=Thiocystis violacea TaxID=13725 RepID=UPI001F5BE4B0|nr:DNA-binding protein [Thiocystis violacea]
MGRRGRRPVSWRPTVAAVRAALGGHGGLQEISAGVNDWIGEAACRFQLPVLPEALQSGVVTLWESACVEAARRGRRSEGRELHHRRERLGTAQDADRAGPGGVVASPVGSPARRRQP